MAFRLYSRTYANVDDWENSLSDVVVKVQLDHEVNPPHMDLALTRFGVGPDNNMTKFLIISDQVLSVAEEKQI